MPTILAINANTSRSITDLVASHLQRAVAPDTRIVAVTGRFGAAYISTEASHAIAGHAALDAFARHQRGCDAVLLACFGEPGLFALREISPVPVVGMAEASMRLAAASGGRFSIVTGGLRWPAMLTRLADALGFAASLARVRGIALTGVQVAADPDAALATLADECRKARAEDGADTVILGGAGLAGLGVRVEALVGFPVIDSVVASAREAERLAGGGAWSYPRPENGPVTPTIGLDADLAAWIRD